MLGRDNVYSSFIMELLQSLATSGPATIHRQGFLGLSVREAVAPHLLGCRLSSVCVPDQ